MMGSVTYCSRREAELATPDPRCAVISITNPGTTPASIAPGWHSVHRVAFDDIDFDSIQGVYTRVLAERHYDPITADQARDIKAFVDSALDNGVSRFVIHCEMGVSRSAGVAVWLVDYLREAPGKPLEAEHHNVYVRKTLDMVTK